MKVLIIAPHPDDEILGCGGTIAKHVHNGNDVFVCIVTCSKIEKFKTMHENYALKINKQLGVKDISFLNFPTVELAHVETREFNSAFSTLMAKLNPSIVYLPFYGDMHTDHTWSQLLQW